MSEAKLGSMLGVDKVGAPDFAPLFWRSAVFSGEFAVVTNPDRVI
jgi:hypothetical protein